MPMIARSSEGNSVEFTKRARALHLAAARWWSGQADVRPEVGAIPRPIERLERRMLLTTIQVTTTLDQVNANDGVTSLREALTQAASLPGQDTITFAPSLAGGAITLSPSLGQLSLDSD